MCKDSSSRGHSDMPFTEKPFWFHMLSVSVSLGRPGHITRQTLLRILRHTQISKDIQGGNTCWIRCFYATECDGNCATNISYSSISGLYKHSRLLILWPGTHIHGSINAHSCGGCHTYLIWFQQHKPSQQHIIQAGYTGPHMQTQTH